MERYRIPTLRVAEVLRLHYTGHSARQVFLALYPAGTSPRPNLGIFMDALNTLVTETESSVRLLAERERIPFTSARNPPGEAEAAELCLSHPVGEEPLAPGDDEALADLDAGRGMLCQEMRNLTDNPPPDAPGPDVNGKEVYVDPAAERAKVVAMLANALSANVSTRLRAAGLRVSRTVTLHNLRIARKEEDSDLARDDGTAPSRVPDPPSLPGVSKRFQLDLDN